MQAAAWPIRVAGAGLVVVAVVLHRDGAFSVAAMVVGAGLLLAGALLPRLAGEQRLSATGITLNVEADTARVQPPPATVPAGPATHPVVKVGNGPAVPLQPGDTMAVRVTARTPGGETAETTVQVTWAAP
ncbi:MAG TPA: hypothetical protein VF519_16675 [Mycobacteriales bacterium]